MAHLRQRQSQPTKQPNLLKDVSTYDLVFELIARIREMQGFPVASFSQLQILAQACLDELVVRNRKAISELRERDERTGNV